MTSFFPQAFSHFPIAYWCVLVAVYLPIACSYIAKFGGDAPGAGARFDNRDPRGWLARQGGRSARANAAQANSFENLPFFIGAVVIAQQMGAPRGWVDALALAYVAARIVFIAAYVGDRPGLRSVVYTVGLLLNTALLFAGWR